MSDFLSSFISLLQSAINIYIYILLLRFMLQKLGANYYNAIIQVFVKLTDFIVKPMRRIIPGFRGYDVAIATLIIIFQLIAILVGLLFLTQDWSKSWALVLIIIGELGKKILYIYLAAIIIQSIVSWFPSLYKSPASEIVYLLVDPVMRRARRIIPPIAGIDLSAIPVLFLIYIIIGVILNPLIVVGFRQLML